MNLVLFPPQLMQGHVGIVLAHTLPDCQVMFVCGSRCMTLGHSSLGCDSRSSDDLLISIGD